MQPRTAQKRSATFSADASTSQISSHAPKKTRFVEPDEDPVNFAEEVDSALENPSARRKGRVKNEGYESDSSDDGEGVVLSRKKDGDDDDDDMFAMAEKEEKKEEAGGKKKEEFLRLGDIEGQEFNEDEDDESDLEDEPEDQDEVERRKKAGMGYELSSFNMREEMEEGKFAADGTYVRSFDAHAIHDRWMDNLDEKEIKLARRRKRQQERVQREKMKAEERELAQSGGKGGWELQLVGMLKKGETVLEALQRLGTKSKQNSRSTKYVVNNVFSGAADPSVYAAGKSMGRPKMILRWLLTKRRRNLTVSPILT
jgi:CD2 antigen cytoplasmic tail-binding protein 2